MLAFRHRQDAATIHFGNIGGVIQRQADDAGGERIQPDADLRQHVVDVDQLQQQRRAAHELDIRLDHPAQQ